MKGILGAYAAVAVMEEIKQMSRPQSKTINRKAKTKTSIERRAKEKRARQARKKNRR